jgi:antitoxin component YwqK of YwqJK toxin-antitoxin module
MNDPYSQQRLAEATQAPQGLGAEPRESESSDLALPPHEEAAQENAKPEDAGHEGPQNTAQVNDQTQDELVPSEPEPVERQVEDVDPQGQVLLRTSLLGDVLHGPMERFLPDGRLSMRSFFQKGVLHGLTSIYDDEGILAQECEYFEGVQHGLLRVYVKGQCLSEQTYAHGQLHGYTQSFDASGQVVARMPYVNGELEGLVQFYNEGSVMRLAHYRKGLLHGTSSDFDNNGDLVQECHFEANVLQGRLRRFWPNGEVMEELFYKDGKPIAPPKRFDAKGKETDPIGATPSLLDRVQTLIRGD